MLCLLRDFLIAGTKTPRTARRLLRKLIDSGQPVTVDELIDALWGHCSDGGPLTAENNVKVYISRLRKNLRPGVRIISDQNRRYVLEISREFAERTLLDTVAKKLKLERR